MKTFKKIFVTFNILTLLFAQPYIVFAQFSTLTPQQALQLQATAKKLAEEKAAKEAAALKKAQNLAASQSVRGRYNPNINIQGSGSSFQGIQFSGVGGAIAGCSNAGGAITDGLSDLFKSKAKKEAEKKLKSEALKKLAASNKVPVEDQKANDIAAKKEKREQCLNGVAYAVSHTLLQQVTNKTLSWVSTGLNGDPLYVRDVDSYLKNIRDNNLNNFVNNIAGDDPVFGNALRSTVVKDITGKSDGLLRKTMDTPEGREYAAFQKDFTNGGWSAFLNPANNPIGASFNAAERLSKKIYNDQEKANDEIQRNNGFLDMKKCVEWYGPDDTVGEDGDLCRKYQTVTPGSVIASQVNNVTNSAVRQLEYSDAINEVLGSFFDGMLNKLFSNGIAGLARNGGYSSGLSNNVLYGSNGQLLSGSSTTNITGNLGYQSTEGTRIEDFDISHPQQLRAVIKTQIDFLNRSQDSQMVMNEIVPTLGALDYCFPGPNPTWTDGVDTNFSSWWGSLRTPDPNKPASTLGAQIGTGAGLIGGAFAGAAWGSAVPGLGTAIGAVAGLLGGLLGGLFDNDKGQERIIVGQPVLYDKVSGQSISLRNYILVGSSKRADYGEYVEKLPPRYPELMKEYSTKFSETALTQAFTSLIGGAVPVLPTGGSGYVDPGGVGFVGTTGEPRGNNYLDPIINPNNQNPINNNPYNINLDYMRGFIKDTLVETSRIVLYDRTVSDYDNKYTISISDSENAIDELLTINDEIYNIVSVAKARYIADKKAAGTPVNLACLDKVYKLDKSPIQGSPRKESDVPSELVNKSIESRNYFYSNL